MRDAPASYPFQAEDDAATPLTNDEKTGLIPSWVTYRHELNQVEQANITKGAQWAFRQKRRELLEERFVRDLHKRMLGGVWTWTGQYRTTERNMRVPAWQIGTDLRVLLDDTRLWVKRIVFGPDELAVWFHHRLVAIHPFPNGNGRHARLMADLRAQYIAALPQADAHEPAALIAFACSISPKRSKLPRDPAGDSLSL